jgi:hypothetical protein
MVLLERRFVVDSAVGFRQNTQNPRGEIGVNPVVNPKTLTSVKYHACFS